MAKYKDADELFKRLNACKYSVKKTTKRQATYNYAISQACRIVDSFPAADVVPRGILEQVMWERDIAISQLAEIGKGLGEKMDDVQEVRYGRWIMHIDDLFPKESTMECDQCHEEQPLECDDKYCPACGAKMEATE